MSKNTGKNPGDFELALCKQWAITDIVCRQSGGVTEKLWREIAMKRKFCFGQTHLSSFGEHVSFFPQEQFLICFFQSESRSIY